MKDNMRHAITVKECSQVVENAHLNNGGVWLGVFRRRLNLYGYSIFSLCDTVRSSGYHSTPQGDRYWDAFRRRGYTCYV